MSLDALIDVGRGIMPPEALSVKGIQAKFLFGIQYVPPSSSQPIFELVYERPRMSTIDRLIVNLLKIIGYEDFQNQYSGVPYVIKTSSLEELSSKSAKPVRDYRHVIFGSRAIYKSFFKVLNEKRLSGSISKVDYQKVYDCVQSLFDAMYDEIKSTKNPLIIFRSIKKFIKDFEQNEIIALYLEEAKLRLPNRLY